jgi:hypothetical protein
MIESTASFVSGERLDDECVCLTFSSEIEEKKQYGCKTEIQMLSPE